MINYTIKSSNALTNEEIQIICKHLNIGQFSASNFRQIFSASDFHILTDNEHLVSFARINYDFNLKIGDDCYGFTEFVGFVSIIKGNGYGSKILKKITQNLIHNQIECIGFCEKPLRPFYEKNSTEILYNKAAFIKEYVDGERTSSTDDDILCINLSAEIKELLSNLTEENLAFYVENK